MIANIEHAQKQIVQEPQAVKQQMETSQSSSSVILQYTQGSKFASISVGQWNAEYLVLQKNIAEGSKA